MSIEKPIVGGNSSREPLKFNFKNPAYALVKKHRSNWITYTKIEALIEFLNTTSRKSADPKIYYMFPCC